jgi:hypothetical protein
LKKQKPCQPDLLGTVRRLHGAGDVRLDYSAAPNLKGSTMSEAKIERLPYVSEGSVITSGKEDYYVDEINRGSLTLIRLSDLKKGFKLPLVSAGQARKATDEERGRVYDQKIAELDAKAAYRAGALVKPNKPSAKVKKGQLYVIIKVNAKSVSIVELGGNASGAYLTAPVELLDIVKPEDVLK